MYKSVKILIFLSNFFRVGYCNLAYPNFTDGNVKYIREGFEKRVNHDLKKNLKYS